MDGDRITFRAPPGLRTRLDAIADAERRSLSNQIVKALEDWLACRDRRLAAGPAPE